MWEPSREHGFHALRHFFASEELAAGESIVSLARWLGHSDPGFTLRKSSHFLPRAGALGSRRHRRDLRVAATGPLGPWSVARSRRRPKVPEKDMPPHPSLTR